MKRFRFALRSVIVVREHRELRAREALAAAMGAQRQAEEVLLAAQGRLIELESVMAVGRRGNFRAADQASFCRAYSLEWAGATEKSKRLAVAQTEVATRRNVCIEANRQLEMVVQLEDKAKTAHRAAVLHAEQQELDEIAGFRALQRKITP